MARAAAEVAPIPRGEDGEPVFREPWEAQAFAMTLALYERGLFTWTEWAAALSAAIKQAQATGDCDDGSTYYQHWLAAIEQLGQGQGHCNRAGAGGAPWRMGPCGTRDAAWAADPARERSSPVIRETYLRAWQ